MPGLELSGLQLRRGGFTLGPVDLVVGAGETLALLGPSGSGKTTLLETVAGFHVPSAGGVRVAGRDVTRLPPERRGMALVVQDYALFPHLSVAQNVAFGLAYHRLPRDRMTQRVRQALAALRVLDLAGRRPAGLSGGERQRVALARALVTDPAAFLLDEPLAALDVATRQQVRAELKQFLAGLSAACLLVTHDQLDALALAGTLAVIAGGRIRQIGKPEHVYRRPCDVWVARFLGMELLPVQRIQGHGAERAYVVAGVPLRAGGACQADPAALAVRPEDVQVLAGAVDRLNTLRGTLGALEPEGALTRVQVALDGGGSLAALLTRRELARLTPREGQPVTCWIEPDDLWPVRGAGTDGHR